MTNEPHTTDHAHAGHIHVVSMPVLIAVFAALLVLTVLTVAVWTVDLGKGALLISLAIAVVKAGLVALYFMHLRYDSLFNGVVLIGALIFVVAFISISLMDASEYLPDRVRYEVPQDIDAAH